MTVDPPGGRDHVHPRHSIGRVTTGTLARMSAYAVILAAVFIVAHLLGSAFTS